MLFYFLFPNLRVIMDTQFEYYIGSLEDFLSQARTISDNSLMKIQLAPSTLPGYFDYTHVLDNFAIRHIFTKHASEKEVLRGQIKIEDDDILLLPSLLNNFDNLHMEVMPGGRTLIHYRKNYPDCIRIYIEEVRKGRHELAGVTYFKRKRRLTGAKS